jgi:Protein of unknown function (DUF1566)
MNPKYALIRKAGFAWVALALTASAAQAVDLRSWDRKYDLASERFQVLAAFNNEAVLDKETQLVWERSPDATLRNWRDANRNCSLLKTLGNRKGWRLPFVFELNSLVNPSPALGEPRLPVGHPFNGISGPFWTATADEDAYGAYTVYFSGTSGYSNAGKTLTFRVWCVRGSGGYVPF